MDQAHAVVHVRAVGGRQGARRHEPVDQRAAPRGTVVVHPVVVRQKPNVAIRQKPNAPVSGRSSGPYESVVPPSDQRREPALTPLSSTPDSQAPRTIRSRPWTRHTASRFAAEPLTTHTASCSRTAPSTSSRCGVGTSWSRVRSKPAALAASCIRAVRCSASPVAVPTYITRGLRPWAPDRPTAWCTGAWNDTMVRPPARCPPEGATIVGSEAVHVIPAGGRARWGAPLDDVGPGPRPCAERLPGRQLPAAARHPAHGIPRIADRRVPERSGRTRAAVRAGNATPLPASPAAR